jgi:drug/metabolite transporter (DMT)-like permease
MTTPQPSAEIAPSGRQPISMTAALLALTCAALWAGQAVAVKVAVEAVPPLRVVAIRLALASGLLGVFAVVGRTSMRLAGRQWLFVVGNGALLLIQLGLFTWGTGRTTSVHSVVLINTFPLMAGLACHFLLPGFPLSGRALTGLLLGVAGTMAVAWRADSGDGSATLWGDLIVLASAAMMGLKIAYMKAVLREVPPLALVFWTAVVTLPAALAVSWLIEPPGWPDQPLTWAALAYQGVAVSGLAFLLWNVLLSRHDPTELVVFRTATPLLGVVLGWALLGEAVDSRLAVGAALVAAGMLLASMRRTRNRNVVTAADSTDAANPAATAR